MAGLRWTSIKRRINNSKLFIRVSPKENQMKITRNRIREIVKEALSNRLKENDPPEAPEGNQSKDKQKADIARIEKKLGQFKSQLEPLLKTIDNRIEFEQFLKLAIQLGSERLDGMEISQAVRNINTLIQRET